MKASCAITKEGLDIVLHQEHESSEGVILSDLFLNSSGFYEGFTDLFLSSLGFYEWFTRPILEFFRVL